MALYINYKTEWHIGEPVPENLGRVVTFQADGDELNLFLDAIVASRGEHPRVEYRKTLGFTSKQMHTLEDPYGIIAATLIFPDGRRVNLSQKALDLLETKGSHD